MKPILVGVDIGGTTVKLAFIDEFGVIEEKWEIETNHENSGKYIIRDVSEAILQKIKAMKIPKKQLIAVGVGAPGYIDVDNGVIIEAVNLGWENYPLRKELVERLNLPVVVDNDANLAAGGEKWMGAGEGEENLLVVTLGTGVGGGVIAGGEIIHGQYGMAGEIGHIASVKRGGAPCNCGKTGCLETFVSATGIARLAVEAVQAEPIGYLKKVIDEQAKLTAKDVFDGVKYGDQLATEVVKESAEHLGFALANIANTLNPGVIVIGGGVSKAGSILIEYIRESFVKYAIPKIAKETHLKLALLENDAGVLGAAWLAKKSKLPLKN